MNTGRTRLITAFLILFSLILCAQDKTDKILFLNFRYIKGVPPQLTTMKIVKGKLKKQKNTSFAQHGLLFEVFSKENRLLYKNSAGDDLENIYEYPYKDGKINNVKLMKDTTYVTLRVPYSAEIDKIQLYNKTFKEDTFARNTPGSSASKYEFPINHSLIEGKK